MRIKHKIVAAALSGLAIAGIVAATSLSFPQSTSAQTNTPAAPATTTTVPVGRGGPRGDIKGGGTHLAQALGITETDLQTAQTKAQEAEIKQAVTDGLITQAQADAMLRKTGGRRVRVDLRGADLDHEKFLAEALGITVEKLQAAQETAATAELAQAVTDGRITQAQADQITAERALQKYIADNGLFKSAVDSAVKAGVITQAQADTILSQTKPGAFGFGGMGRGGFDGGPGGRGGPGGHGGRGGPDQTQNGAAQPSTQS